MTVTTRPTRQRKASGRHTKYHTRTIRRSGRWTGILSAISCARAPTIGSPASGHERDRARRTAFKIGTISARTPISIVAGTVPKVDGTEETMTRRKTTRRMLLSIRRCPTSSKAECLASLAYLGYPTFLDYQACLLRLYLVTARALAVHHLRNSHFSASTEVCLLNLLLA